MRRKKMADQEIIVCRTADGDLVKYGSFDEAVRETIKATGKDLSEIVITASDNYRCVTNRKIGRKGLLLHDILNDKNASEEDKADARKQLDEIEKGMLEESIRQITDTASPLNIESVEVVYYLGACDNIYYATQEYYDNYKKRQEANS